MVFLAQSERSKVLEARVSEFMERYVIPNEPVYRDQHAAQSDIWNPPPIVEEIKAKAKSEGLWNLFLPESEYGAGLTNLEYAPLCAVMGQSYNMGTEVFNCSAPDTGNMEILERFGTEEHKETWLKPLLEGEIRSAFAMSEPAVASSDATNIQLSIRRDGDDYVLNGRKWWISGSGDNRCKLLIVLGNSNPEAARHQQHSMILVPKHTPGVTLLRPLTVMGYNHAPVGHFEIDFKDVRVPTSNMLLGEGRGFEIAQARLGPGRIHHCMRLIGMAERALQAMVVRAQSRTAFGKLLSDQGTVREDIARSRIEIESARMLTLNAAHMMDTVGNKVARAEIAMIKVLVPNVALGVIDRAIQIHGAAGLSEDYGLADAYAFARTTRLADGPDAVHLAAIAKIELGKVLPEKPWSW